LSLVLTHDGISFSGDRPKNALICDGLQIGPADGALYNPRLFAKTVGDLLAVSKVCPWISRR
jgi:hypothetical protein